MINQVVLIGRIVDNTKIIEIENGMKECTLTLAVPRRYKNINGEYETDLIDCILFDNVAINTLELCKKGDIVGLRGEIQSSIVNSEKIINIVAKKVTFIK